ncbi:hypothetical protein SNOG_20144 [Parastagonospora nodorum SN15]|uniref:Uncharacterized protein n=1 Tax=Phaeosphaeria nodorum (strain SN15 / ATCC MYA-4574 / FGSC 10173) TaxID=321614 RepID=A9JXE1_PHANO|nr:hypothetical protein SNOG_20144 [Parastagonospora nodorum SN15]EDP89830.1 hypothetical protein SNOG_20144 [Parastagonospora nodorum SN15]
MTSKLEPTEPKRASQKKTRDVSGEHHASIVNKWIFLQGLNRMAQETENLC